jgi:2-deoxy-D-gluconate 3-dehydrogenase
MIARGFVENGVKTYIVSRKSEDLEATAKELSAVGECIAIPSDLSTLKGIEEFVAEYQKHETKLDLLINNSGATWGGTVEDFPEEGWDKVVDINLKSPFFLVQKFLPLLRASANAEDPARVVNISSVGGLDVKRRRANYSYSASKAGLIHLTKHLALDLSDDNIIVNGIAPGVFYSKMTAFMLDEHEEQFAQSLPRNRIGRDTDVAGTAIYLCSKASAWVTGHTIVLDGGALIEG